MKWLLVVAGVLLALGCGGKKEEKGGPGGGGGGRRGPMQFPVELVEVQSRPVEFVVHAVGTVEAFETVQITARVAGAVEKVRFTEGQTVEANAVLAEIEPRRFQLAVRAAEASVTKARASLADAQASLQRREQVNQSNPGLIRGEELETFRTQARTAEAEVAQAQVALEQAQLNLRDAYVRSPVPGILQSRSVQTGQYVNLGHVLATVTQREPLLLRFSVPEADAGRMEVGALTRFTVKNGAQPFEAKIQHVAAQASPESRMISVTAQIASTDQLRPGSFAEVTVPIGQITAPVIPQTAVRPSEKGFLAYVVEGNVAKERVLQLGMRTPDGRVEVRAGLKPGEQLVVRGAEALRDGAPVLVAPSPVNPTTPPPGDSPAGSKG